MNRAVLRWSGIGLVICALAASAVGPWLLLRMRIAIPVDGTHLSITLSLVFWGAATAQLGFHLWMRSTARWQSETRSDIQPIWTTAVPLSVTLIAFIVQTLFLVTIAALTLLNGAIGVAPADLLLVAADLLIAQAIINLLVLVFGGVRLNFRRNESVIG
jgi:hypothetical protein